MLQMPLTSPRRVKLGDVLCVRVKRQVVEVTVTKINAKRITVERNDGAGNIFLAAESDQWPTHQIELCVPLSSELATGTFHAQRMILEHPVWRVVLTGLTRLPDLVRRPPSPDQTEAISSTVRLSISRVTIAFEHHAQILHRTAMLMVMAAVHHILGNELYQTLLRLLATQGDQAPNRLPRSPDSGYILITTGTPEYPAIVGVMPTPKGDVERAVQREFGLSPTQDFDHRVLSVEEADLYRFQREPPPVRPTR